MRQRKPELGMDCCISRINKVLLESRTPTHHAALSRVVPTAELQMQHLDNAHLEQNVGLWSSNREIREMGIFKQ